MGLLFTYGLTYGGAVVSLINPFYGLLIYICFAIIKPPALWHWSVPVGNYSRIIAIAFLLGWALNGFGKQRIVAGKSILWCLLGYWLWVTLSTLFSADPSLGLPHVEYLAKIVLPFIAGLTLIDSEKKLKQLFLTILGSCGFLAYEANLAYRGGYMFEQLGFLGIDNNSFSILMAASFGLALVFSLMETRLWRCLLLLGIAAAMAHVPMFAFSRGGMVGIGLATIVAIGVLPKTPRLVGAVSAVLLIGSVLAGPSVVKEFSTSFQNEQERDYSSQSRIDLWKDCTTTMFQNPLFGVGQEHWGVVAPSFGWPNGKEAHSLWFQTAAELGIPGVTFLASFYICGVLVARRVAYESVTPFSKNLGLAMQPAIIGFAVSAAFVTVEGFELPYYIVLLITSAAQIYSAESTLDAVSESYDLLDDEPTNPEYAGSPAAEIAPA